MEGIPAQQIRPMQHLAMKRLYTNYALTALFCGLSVPAIKAQLGVFYDIENATPALSTITPTYVGRSDAFATASDLTPNGLTVSNRPEITGSGYWLLDGWSIPPLTGFDAPNVSFSITANTAIVVPTTLYYSFFSGTWSDASIGPRALEIWGSFDGFATATLIARHDSLYRENPFGTDTYNNFVEPLSMMRDIQPGETLSIRFIASYDGPWDNPNYAEGGFMRTYVDNSTLWVAFSVTAVPEPSTAAAIAGLLALSSAILARRLQFLRRRRPRQNLWTR